ncbi:MAG: RHS repeat-associated core domain-containing protein, partial [Bradymonadaceae bacterium]|nr:RHS repeat-associated core domain-containing protein [Lujinxingiaceae bacterium]
QTLWDAVWGATIDQLLAWHDHTTGQAHIPIVDHRNSIVTTWNMAQAAVGERAAYNPHGRLTLQGATGPPCTEEGSAGKVCPNPGAMPFGFVSAYRSPATGLVFMRNRWYSPALGQFLSTDPLGFVDSYNPYAYAAFDPINGWDPWGLSRSQFAPGIITLPPNGPSIGPARPGSEKDHTIQIDDPYERQKARDKRNADDVRNLKDVARGVAKGIGSLPYNTPWGLSALLALKYADPEEFERRMESIEPKNSAEALGSTLGSGLRIGKGFPGVAQSRINLAKGKTRFTPLRKSGEPHSAGWNHVVEGHFNREISQSMSVFTVSQGELKTILQSKHVVKSPVHAGDAGQWVRIVDVGTPIGTSALKRGGESTSVIKVFTDDHGNLITAYPW